jgi:hypothetical protein
MSAEFPVAAAGSVAIISGWAQQGGPPKNLGVAVIGTLVLVLIASMTKGTKVEPVFTGIAWLFLLAVLVRAVPAFNTTKKGK